ncbi:MAG: pyruvate kinase [Actinobacteria bacterium]|uniref:pyruvate kinase n=2 Tax=freshwater metagenome TaxID=449393 RepID=A0A6J6PLP1_9ZZZZ|nr:pyruvate kinase [Actinomycetota bacterium]MSY11862.1 pyruvate kinase [Actinomycetota bacterium]MSZ04038.1 pyruvate kinase [Actinomycetota bacterium]
MTRRTKIVATVGPASESPDALEALIRAGVDVFRLNLSHGTLEEHLERVVDIRAAADRVGRAVGVLADLPGPKVRCAPFPDGGVMLETLAVVELAAGSAGSDQRRIEIEYPSLLSDIRMDDYVILGDGAITLRVLQVAPVVRAVVETGGRVQGRPGAHLHSERLRLETPTAEDLVLARAMAAADVDFLAVSFVRAAADLRRVREVVGDWRGGIVAKIETAPAVAALNELVEEADAIMVARGDLGIECPMEDVPHLQKQIVRRCVESGVPVITATQMLESMITAPAPTRAEVSDVANAVFDGTDAVMLSGETAIGADPIRVVRTMARITERAERESAYRQWANRLGRVQRSLSSVATDNDRITFAITHAAQQAAVDIGASAILCCTRSGNTARAMARFRPEARLIGLSPNLGTVRSMTLSWGVEPLQVDVYRSIDDLVWFAVERSVGSGAVKHGELVVVLAGEPRRGTGGATDVLRVVRVT